ncbi:MAG: hypothetical protein BBJ57_09065 [Desulfobacterales bacterium PC51MH44]|nr:MAG: hypothetical protein BBJ57_09065 [Desulfobacterales bacterium PC51MH44]
MKKLLKLFMILGFIVGTTPVVYATTILYDLTDLGGGVWEYDYSVTNDTLTSNIEEFTIFFEYGLYENLSVTSLLADWDEIAIDPALILGVPDDGFYDALAILPAGIAPGTTVSGFSVSFDWLGSDTPWGASQSFDVVDPITFASLDSGGTAPIPEPGTIVLVGTGLAGLAGIGKRLNRKRTF